MRLDECPASQARISEAPVWRVEGPKLKGTVLPGGACWMLMRHDDVLAPKDMGG
jgi:hypothetical protein